MQFAFGDWVLDSDRRELSRGSEPIAVGPQVFDLLVYLVENRDRVVSKDELFDIVWRGRTVSESTLTSHINAARRALSDSGEEQRLIRTISRKGFRFVGEVKEAQSRGAAKPRQERKPNPIPAKRMPRRSARLPYPTSPRWPSCRF